MFQHLFWFFGHPEVYVIILPVFGLIGFVLSMCSGIVVFSYIGMVYSIWCIVGLGFYVWVHHMFVASVDVDSRVYFGVVSLYIGVPTSIKVCNWVYSLVSSVVVNVVGLSVLSVVLFIGMFIVGGLTGLLLANAGLDVGLHDSYFVVSHFHFVLSLGAVVGVIAGISVCIIVVLPLEVSSYWLYIYGLVFVVGSVLVFVPLHICGLLSLPRRVSD